MPLTYQEAVEEIKSRLDIVEVVSRYVVLKKSGANYMGCCPFHQEKTPSFSVNRQKGICYCFACHEGGDAITFLEKIQNKSFKEVIEDEAKNFGIELPATIGGGNFSKKKTAALEAMKKASEFFTENLFNSPDAEFAREYLKKRSISDEVIKKYGLGYAPKGYDELQKHLNTDISYLETAGLVSKREREKGYIDRFRNRLIIPVKDENGHIVAFGARALTEGQNPKYLNSPDTILYNKSRILYGFDTAKEAIKELDSVLICEGYFDAISLQTGGVKNAVASCGTALTQDHIRLIAKYCESRKIYLAFDTDNAGQMATERSAELIKTAFGGLGDIKQFDSCYVAGGGNYSCEIRVVSPPEGKDPDEFIREKGGNAYIEHMLNAPLLLDYRLDKLFSQYSSDMSPLAKNDLVAKIIPLIEEIKNNIVQNEYVKRVATRLQLDEGLLLREIKAFRAKNDEFEEPVFEQKSQIVTKSSNFIEKMQKNLLSVLCTNISDDNRSELIRIIKTQKIEEKNLKLLAETIDKIVFKSNNTKEFIQELFNEFQENNEVKDIITDLIYLSKSYENLTDKEIQTAMFETKNKIELFRRREEIKKLRLKSKEDNGVNGEVQYQITVNEKLKSENWRNNQ
ncbi:MAG: DNA primase [Candidatus Gastranaerophilales bacterium]|nr:DNA primase [Candidatus Gastranaerophilales bacterium]